MDSKGLGFFFLLVFFFGIEIFIMLYSLRRKNTSYFSVEQVFLTKPSNSPGVIQIAPERERGRDGEEDTERGRIEQPADL